MQFRAMLSKFQLFNLIFLTRICSATVSLFIRINANMLTCRELKKMLEIIHSLVNIGNMGQFRLLALSLKELVECDHIIFGLPEANAQNAGAVDDLNINYPQDWVDLYQAKELWRIDPVVLAVTKNSAPQHWDEIYKKFPPDKKFLGLAHDFGMQNGCTCLSRGGAFHASTIISVSGKFKKNRVAYILEMLSPHFHLALASLKAKDKAQKIRNLTNRENEVLKWLSQGKTSWEIAMILKVAEVTVNFHVNNIKAKLNVASRSHAVAVACHTHWLGHS